MTQNTKDNLIVILFILIIFNMGFMSGVIYVEKFCDPVQIKLEMTGGAE